MSSILRKAVTGTMWVVLTSLVARAIGVVGTLVLTRFMAPDAYGEVSAATVVVLTASQFSATGDRPVRDRQAGPRQGRPIPRHGYLPRDRPTRSCSGLSLAIPARATGRRPPYGGIHPGAGCVRGCWIASGSCRRGS